MKRRRDYWTILDKLRQRKIFFYILLLLIPARPSRTWCCAQPTDTDTDARGVSISFLTSSGRGGAGSRPSRLGVKAGSLP